MADGADDPVESEELQLEQWQMGQMIKLKAIRTMADGADDQVESD